MILATVLFFGFLICALVLWVESAYWTIRRWRERRLVVNVLLLAFLIMATFLRLLFCMRFGTEKGKRIKRTLYTIGHSTRSIEEFIALLKAAQVELLADVRRFPGSRRHPQFGQAAVAQSLAKAGIEYRHFPDLGGRRSARKDSPNTAWRNAAFRGYADYMMSEAFHDAVDRLIELASHKCTAIMCAEALWWQCHRGLIADYLKAAGHKVIHLVGAGKTEEHPYTSAARIVNGQLSYAASETAAELFS